MNQEVEVVELKRKFIKSLLLKDTTFGIRDNDPEGTFHSPHDVKPLDLDAAINAHIMGPEHSKPAKFTESRNGKEETHVGHFRLSFSGGGEGFHTNYFAIGFSNFVESRWGLKDASGAVLETQVNFEKHGIKTYVEYWERCLQFRLWGFLDKPLPVQAVSTLCYNMIPERVPCARLRYFAEGPRVAFAEPLTNSGIEINPKFNFYHFRKTKVEAGYVSFEVPFYWADSQLGRNLLVWNKETHRFVEANSRTLLRNSSKDILAVPTDTNRLPNIDHMFTEEPEKKRFVRFQSGDRSRRQLERYDFDFTAELERKCVAVRNIRAAAKAGKETHFMGMSIVYLAMQFKRGREWLRSILPGWDKTLRDKKQIDHAYRTGYAPYSCASMQREHICPYNDPEHCFKARTWKGELVSPSPLRSVHAAQVARDHWGDLEGSGIRDNLFEKLNPNG